MLPRDVQFLRKEDHFSHHNWLHHRFNQALYLTDPVIGANGENGTDQRSVFNYAFNYANAQNKGMIIVPPGTYWISIDTGVDYSVLWKRNVSLIGTDRDRCIIKLLGSQGNFDKVFTNNLQDVGRITIANLTFDFNDTNNPVTTLTDLGWNGSTFTKSRHGIYISQADSLDIINCRFTDFDNVNTVMADGSVKHFRLEGCIFDNAGNSGVDHDHSTVYWTGKNGYSGTYDGDCFIANNLFEGASAGAKGARTAIETHGGRQQVHNNIIRNYALPANITGVATATEHIQFTGNELDGCRFGVMLWSMNDFGASIGLREGVFAHNIITLDPDSWVGLVETTGRWCAGFLNGTVEIPMDNLIFDSNIIRYKSFSGSAIAADAYGSGFSFNTPSVRHSRWKVINNIIDSPMLAGWWSLAQFTDIDIINNTVRNPGQLAGGAVIDQYRTGIFIGANSASDVIGARVNGNHIVDDQTPTEKIKYGVYFSAAASDRFVNCEALDNRVRVASGTAIPDMTADGDIFIRMIMDTYSGVGGQATYGSEILDKANGVKYRQTAAPKGTTWVTS